MFDFSGDAIVDPKLKRAQSLVGSSAGRPADDFYRTPPKATEALLSVEQFDGNILEPACGDGAISRILVDHSHDVISTDLVYRGYGEQTNYDFLSDDYPYLADNVVTNPPFTYGQQFIELALKRTTRKVAILGKLQLLEGIKRRAMFETTPFTRLWVFSKRITMARNGEREKYSSSMIAFGWYIWQHGYVGQPTIGWL